MKRFMVMCMSLLVATTMLMAQDGAKKYGIKSGTITMVSEVMGQKIESKSYFDDYGALEASNTKTFGMEIATISRDGKIYIVNKAAKQVQEMPAQDNVNYLNMSDEIVSKYKIQEVGNETVAGKDCIKYTMEVSQMGQTLKLTVSVWNGIPMKTVTNANGTEVTATVTSIEEGDVDASMFEVPTFEK